MDMVGCGGWDLLGSDLALKQTKNEIYDTDGARTVPDAPIICVRERFDSCAIPADPTR